MKDESSHPVGVREIGRELALIALFASDVGGLPLKEVLDFRWFCEMTEFSDEDGQLFAVPSEQREETFRFAWELLQGAVCNLERIDPVLKAHLVKWTFERMHAVDRAILRISIYSLLYQQEIPIEVVISEANELSDKYSDEKASHYVNGILNEVKNRYRKNFILERLSGGPSLTARAAAGGTSPRKKVVLKKRK